MPARTHFTLALLVLLASPLPAQQGESAIAASDIRAHIRYLASDELAGRATGSPGNVMAAAYIARLLGEWQLEPMGDSGTYYQHFTVVTGVRAGGGNALRAEGRALPGGTIVGTTNVDFTPLGFSTEATVSGGLVLAGYGITSADSAYDDYRNLDCSGRIVIVLRYSPDGSDPHGALSRYSAFQTKTRTARERGAAGLIVVTGPADESEDRLMPLRYDQGFPNGGIPCITVRREFADRLIAAAGWTIGAVQDSIRRRSAPVAFAVPGVTVTLTTDLARITERTANVIARLRPADPAMEDQALVIGAHFDHLGMGGEGSGSLQPDTVAIHHGADDNASGTAGLLELARAFAGERASLGRSLVFAFFSGEELGTLGSAYYVSHPAVPLDRTVAMLNMDMVGRLTGKALTVNGTGTSPAWEGVLDRENADSSLSLTRVPDGYGPSDHAQFYGKDVPVLFFFTGTHADYHRPSDTWDKINYPGEEKVVRFVYRVALDIDRARSRPPFTRAAAAQSPGGDARAFRTTLGIIPEYSFSGNGMKIGVVRPGGPAEKAGLKPGDVIVRMAGRTIVNIYDYMEMLGKLKGGDRADLVVMRDGREVLCTAEMAGRK
ncbi:MAG TPA: M28 family peptidase [Bacteroidota bacterium]|nr:M28 family peptidase [Bacteroidota bacterium]